MNIRHLVLVTLASAISLISFAQEPVELKYVDAGGLTVIGKGFEGTANPYSRLPLSIRHNVSPELWTMGMNSAGVAVRFSSNASCIGAKWTVISDFHRPEQADTGVRGLDLYVLRHGRWHFLGVAKPEGKESSDVIARNIKGGMQEFLLYLPLYDGIERLEIGCDSSAVIELPKVDSLVDNAKRPIVFYGSGITEGGCAGRPGMAYPAILERLYNRRTVNLGFSGNARLDLAVAEAMAKVDADEYVLDCLADCDVRILKDSAYNFISCLLDARPGTPVFLVEDAAKRGENAYWNELYKRLSDEGHPNLYYITSQKLLGIDGDGTVDGVHPNDEGFFRISEELVRCGVGRRHPLR